VKTKTKASEFPAITANDVQKPDLKRIFPKWDIVKHGGSPFGKEACVHQAAFLALSDRETYLVSQKWDAFEAGSFHAFQSVRAATWEEMDADEQDRYYVFGTVLPVDAEAILDKLEPEWRKRMRLTD